MISPAALLSSRSGQLAPVADWRAFLPIVAGLLPGDGPAAALDLPHERRRYISDRLPIVVGRVVVASLRHCPSVRSFVSSLPRRFSCSAKPRLAQEPFRDLQTAFEKDANV